MNVNIRSEESGDEAAIDAVTIAAFRDAEHASHTEQFIVKALREAGALTVSLVAELDGEIVGHVAASPVRIADGAPGWFGLGPLSVQPLRQGCGVGSYLMRHVLDALRARGAVGCVLLGDPAYYRRFGFAPDAGLILQDVPPEYFQALSFDGSRPRGVVAYHEGFDARC